MKEQKYLLSAKLFVGISSKLHANQDKYKGPRIINEDEVQNLR